jgi:hypothetical protein
MATMMPQTDGGEPEHEHSVSVSTSDIQATATFKITVPAELDDDDVPLRGGIEELVRRQAREHFERTYGMKPDRAVVTEDDFAVGGDEVRYEAIVMNSSSGARSQSDEYGIQIAHEDN